MIQHGCVLKWNYDRYIQWYPLARPSKVCFNMDVCVIPRNSSEEIKSEIPEKLKKLPGRQETSAVTDVRVLGRSGVTGEKQ